MKSIYLTVIVILTSTVLTAQIKQIPLVGNPVLKKEHKAKMAEIGYPEESNNYQLRGHCPDINPDINYLLPTDSFTIVLDTANGQAYQVIDPASSIGTIKTSPGEVIFRSNPTTGAAAADLVILRTVESQGEIDSTEFVYSFVVKRPNESLVLPEEVLAAEEQILLCAEPTDNLPGKITCTDVFACADSYGGKDLQIIFLNSGMNSENCFNYFASRFPGRDTVCVVLCDEFTVCDTFRQPFVITGDTIQIPFFEDFSSGGPYPEKDRWLEDLTFVNYTMANNPPSLGVATFEGLDAAGEPYGTGFGTADRLTSKAFDLSDENVNSNMYLSFYHQLKGRSFSPRIKDSLFVEFWTENEEWVKVTALQGDRFLALDSFPDFNFTSIYLDKPEYFHSGFQFRFRNLNENIGAQSAWHVDYIYFDKNRLADSPVLNDFAFSELPGSVLNRYTAMPLNQFEGFEAKELETDFTVKIISHFSDPKPLNNSQGFHSELKTGTTWDPFTLGNAVNLQPEILFEETKPIPSANFDPFLTDIEDLASGQGDLAIALNYELTQNEQIIFATVNDAARTVTNFDNYYAYDDGTAERAIEISGTGTKVALEFEANKSDKLQGVMINFAQVNGDISDQNFELSVWAGGDRPEQNAASFVRSFVFPKRPDSLQSFTTYTFKDFNGAPAPIDIPAGKFYIGITQNSDSGRPFAIGYDRNNPDAVDYFWWTNSNQWKKYEELITFRGALMMRPVMGEVPPNETSVKNTNLIGEEIELFPNPANEVLNFRNKSNRFDNLKIEIFNAVGQLKYSNNLTSQLDISDFRSGVYFVKITDLDKGNVQNHQFIKETF